MKTGSRRSRRHRNPPVPEEQQQQPFFSKAGLPPVQAKEATPFFQSKLTIGTPGDPYEREADSVADAVVSQSGSKPVLQSKEISSVQRLATPDEEKMPGTNDGRMKEDKAIQEKPEAGPAEKEQEEMPVQKAEAAEEEKEPIQKMEAPKEEEPPVQKAEAPKEENEPVQKMEAPKEEEPPVQKAEAPKEEKEPVQKMEAPKEEEQPVQKAMAPKEEKEPVQKMEAPKEEEQPVQKAEAPKEEKEPVQKMEAPKEEEEPPVQTKADANGAAQPAKLSSRLAQRQGKGRPLPRTVRAQMEQGIGAGFDNVNIHTDTEAAELNKDLHAQAFTQGQDIYFAPGKYNPDNTEGKRLLAHELTHVVQQGHAEQHENTGSQNFSHPNPGTIHRLGLLNPAEEAAAAAYNNSHFDEKSRRIFQIITGVAVDGAVGPATVEAIATFQQNKGLAADGKVGADTLNAMVLDRASQSRQEHAIQLVLDFYALDMSNTLSVSYDPTVLFASTSFEPGGLRVIKVGSLAFLGGAIWLKNVIAGQLALPAPAVGPVGPSPSLLTPAQEAAAILFNQSKYTDQRSVKAIQGLVGAQPDGVLGHDTMERIADYQKTNALAVDGKVGENTLEAMVNQLIGNGNEDAAIWLIVEFYNFRDNNNLLQVYYDPAETANAATDFRTNEPVRVTVGPSGIGQPFAGLVHTIAHEYEHVRRLKQGIVAAETHEFLGEAIEILSVGMQQETLESAAPRVMAFVAGFAADARRALINWNKMPLADQRQFKNRFVAVRQRVFNRIDAGTAAQQALHAPLRANYAAVVLP